MADLDVIVGEQAYKCALPGASDSGQRDAIHMKGSKSLHKPTARDTHKRDDNVIFAQLVDLGDAIVCHRERGMKNKSFDTTLHNLLALET